MAHYVISDIHGEADRFYRMLDRIALSAADTLYVLGDVIDRGPDGVALLETIMAAPNMPMLLGNHEYMCLQCFHPAATAADFRRWGKNGNYPTLCALEALPEGRLTAVLEFLAGLPTHAEVEAGGKRFYLVHGFPGESVYREVWGRPAPDTPSPFSDRRLIIGHTPVINMAGGEAERIALGMALQQKGEHLKIFHGPGFIDIDCGCGHDLPVKALACLRLEDMAEFYE